MVGMTGKLCCRTCLYLCSIITGQNPKRDCWGGGASPPNNQLGRKTLYTVYCWTELGHFIFMNESRIAQSARSWSSGKISFTSYDAKAQTYNSGGLKENMTMTSNKQQGAKAIASISFAVLETYRAMKETAKLRPRHLKIVRYPQHLSTTICLKYLLGNIS